MLSSISCEYCEEVSDMEYNFLQKYFHLYWVPMIPLKKKTEVRCKNCGHTYEGKELTKDITVKLNRVKERYPIRTPLWAFSGLIILTLFFCWAFWQSGRHDVTEADYIKDPKKGDVYFMESKPSEYTTEYTTMRIDKVDKDQVYFTYNDTSVSKYTKVFGILNQRYYTNKKGVFTRKKIEELYKKESIFSISRE